MQQTTENVETVVIPAKPMQGKYDKRCLTPKQKASRAPKSQYGPKPQWMKHLARNTAYSVLRAINDLETWPQLFDWAIQCEDRRLVFDMLCYLTDRRDGKPFIAINPAESKQSATLHQDNRLQVAIQQLVVTGKHAKGKKAKQIEAVSAVTEASGTIDAQAPDVSESTQAVDSEAPEPSL